MHDPVNRLPKQSSNGSSESPGPPATPAVAGHFPNYPFPNGSQYAFNSCSLSLSRTTRTTLSLSLPLQNPIKLLSSLSLSPSLLSYETSIPWRLSLRSLPFLNSFCTSSSRSLSLSRILLLASLSVQHFVLRGMVAFVH